MIAAALFIASAISTFEAWRKWRDWKREAASIWIGYDHGSDPYTPNLPSACGEICDISTSAGGDA